jgi:hypothetical protein
MRKYQKHECSFCGRERKAKEVTDTDWISEIHIFNNLTNSVMQRIVACPKCRETHKISELYSIHDLEPENREKTIKRAIQIVKDFENPYPKDIFTWNNKEKLDFNRGRFNRFCFELVEKIKIILISHLEEEI